MFDCVISTSVTSRHTVRINLAIQVVTMVFKLVLIVVLCTTHCEEQLCG